MKNLFSDVDILVVTSTPLCCAESPTLRSFENNHIDVVKLSDSAIANLKHKGYRVENHTDHLKIHY